MTLICQRKDIYLHLEKIKRQKIMEMNQENQGQQNTQEQQQTQQVENKPIDNTVAVVAYIKQ